MKKLLLEKVSKLSYCNVLLMHVKKQDVGPEGPTRVCRKRRLNVRLDGALA